MRRFFKRILTCICHPGVQAEIAANTTSFTTGWIAGVVALSPVWGTIVVNIADAVPCWGVIVMRRYHAEHRGVF